MRGKLASPTPNPAGDGTSGLTSYPRRRSKVSEATCLRPQRSAPSRTRTRAVRPRVQRSDHWATHAPCSFLTVTAVTGNFFVILAVIFDPNRTLRSRVNFLVANLAAAELIVCVHALPLSLEFHIRESMSHLSIASTPLQQDHARRVAYFLLCTASLLSLAALTRDRFIAIKEPFNYRTEINKKQAAMFSQVI